MNRYIVPTFLSIALLSSQTSEASSQPSRDDPKINYALRQIQDEALRELVWASALEISTGTSWDARNLSGLVSALAALKPEEVVIATKCAVKLTSLEILSAEEICKLLKYVRWFSTEQADAFIMLSQNKNWNAEDFECVARSLQHYDSDNLPEVAKVFAEKSSLTGSLTSTLINACKDASTERIGIALNALLQLSEGRESGPEDLRHVFSEILELKSNGENLDSLISFAIIATRNRSCSEQEIRTLLYHYDDKSPAQLESYLEFIESIPAFETLDFQHWRRVIGLIRDDTPREDLRKLSQLCRFFGEDLGWTGVDYVSALESLSRLSDGFVECMTRNAPILKEVATGRNWDAETYGECSLWLRYEFETLSMNKQAVIQTLDLLDENKTWITSFSCSSCLASSKEEVLSAIKQLDYITDKYLLDEQSRSELKRNLSRIPVKEIPGLLKFIEPIVKRTGWHDAYSHLIGDLGYSSEDQLEAMAIKLIPSIAEKGLDASASCKCLDALKNTSANDMEAAFVATQDQSFLPEDMGFIAYGTTHAPMPQVIEVLEKIKSFAQSRGWDARGQSYFLQHFVDRNWDLIEIFLEAAEALSEGKKWQVVDFINLTNVMNCSEGKQELHKQIIRRAVSTLKSAATGKEWDTSTCNDILLALSQTPLERMEETLISAVTLVQEEKLPMDDISSLIHLCSRCTSEQARAVLPKVYTFMNEKGWSSSLIRKTLSSLHGVPVERMLDTLDTVIALAKSENISLEGISYSDLSILTRSFCNLQPGRVETVLHAIQAISNGKSREVSFYAFLANFLGGMENEGLTTALAKVRAVDLGRDLYDYEITGILQSARTLDESKIPDLLRAAGRFMSTVDLATHDKTSVNNYFGNILETLSGIQVDRLNIILDILDTLSLGKRESSGFMATS